MARAEAAGRLRVEVVYSPRAREVWQWGGDLAEGATLADALRASGLASAHPALDLAQCDVGIWGRRCTVEQPLRDRDRVEVYRVLLADPKDARRRRQQEGRGPARAPTAGR